MNIADFPENIKELLPDDYIYLPISNVTKASFMNEPRFEITFRINLFSKEDIINWLNQFQNLSYTTWRVRNTYASDTDRILYKVMYRCQHNTRPTSKNPHKKHTNCNAKIIFTIGKVLKGSKDKEIIKTLPCQIYLGQNHNHLIYAASALIHRDPSTEIKEKFIAMFEFHTPSSALEVHKKNMCLEYGDNFYQIEADRSIIPDIFWVYHLYYKTFEEKYGKGHGLDMLYKLGELVEAFNLSVGYPCSKLKYDDNYFVIAIMTPIMQRAHENIPTAGELVCCDSSGGMDRFQCRVFLLMVHSSIGGLPIGVLITSSESETVITKALDLYKSLLSEKSFYGKGFIGPEVFITDDSCAERQSLKKSFPESSLILCIFHVLQATWRFLWDSKTSIQRDDRIMLFSCLRTLLYCKSKSDFEEMYKEKIETSIVKKYPRFLKYLNKLYERKCEWAICFRDTLPIRGHNTNNVDEAAIRILKDKILLRTKAYNLAQLFQFLTEEIENYYTRKILCSIAGRPDQRLKLDYINLGKKAQKLEVCVTSEELIFKVHNLENNQEYYVDAKSETCSCYVGINGGACKHQFAVFKQEKLPTLQFLPTSNEEKLLFHYIATGQHSVSNNWYSDLQGADNISCSQSMISSVNADTPEQSSDMTSINSSVPTSNNIHTILEAENALKRLYNDILTKIHQYPDQFCTAVIRGVCNYENCKTDAAKVSALVTIGKYSGGGCAQRRSCKARSINVQSTAIARRVKKIGGRKNIITGRPPKGAFTKEHGYSKNKFNSILMPRMRSLAAPHNLSHCVSLNTSLGKSHCVKH